MTKSIGHGVTVEIEPRTTALRASNLSGDALAPGIQPGEKIEARVDGYESDDNDLEPNTDWIPLGRAPTEPGRHTAKVDVYTLGKDGTFINKTVSVPYTVEKAEPRTVDTADPDQKAEFSGGTAPSDTPESIDVSSAPGKQGAENVKQGTSDLAEETGPNADTVAGVEMTPSGPRETDDGFGGAGIVLLALAGLYLYTQR